MNDVTLAREIARRAHDGQTDKVGLDYFHTHVEDVAMRMSYDNWRGQPVVVAYLHDVLEDTIVDSMTLHKLFGTTVHRAVVAITKDRSETYSEYIKRVSYNDLATTVKRYDIASNMAPKRLSLLDNKTSDRLVKKYTKALKELNNATKND